MDQKIKDPTEGIKKAIPRNLISQEEADQQEKERVQAERIATFNKICPPQYRETDIERLTDPNSFLKVTSWITGGDGLLIMGYTRTGKTRAVFQLIKALVTINGIKPHYVKATTFFRKIYTAYMNKGYGESIDSVVRFYKSVPILIIDDFGKEAMTAHYLQYLYEIIDYRCECRKPVIITTNLNPDQLEEKIGDDTVAIPLIERLQEMCEIINFKEPGE